LFCNLKDTFGGIGELYAKQAGLIKGQFGSFFFYYHDELESLKAVLFLYLALAFSISDKVVWRVLEERRVVVCKERALV